MDPIGILFQNTRQATRKEHDRFLQKKHTKNYFWKFLVKLILDILIKRIFAAFVVLFSDDLHTTIGLPPRSNNAYFCIRRKQLIFTVAHMNVCVPSNNFQVLECPSCVSQTWVINDHCWHPGYFWWTFGKIEQITKSKTLYRLSWQNLESN